VPDRAARLATAYPEIDRLFEALVEKGESPGAAWGVIVDGALAHTGVAGVRDVASKEKVAPDTVFRIASMTKSFTAAAILILRDEGKLRLDDPVSRFVPELERPGPTADSPPITIRDLLTHSAGFPEDNAWGDRQLDVPDARVREWLRAGIPRSNAPRVAYEYSNYGFALLGDVVAKASGTPYRDFVNTRLLVPLGMGASAWEARSVRDAKRARGYRTEADAFVEEVPLDDGFFGPMGGLFTSVPDLARWVSFQLQAWPPRDDADAGPLKRASLREMQQAARATTLVVSRDPIDDPLRVSASGYGYGLGSARWCTLRHVVGHSGGLPGWGSRMLWLPEHGVGIVAMANVTYAGSRLTNAIRDSFAALQRTGGLVPRAVTPAPELLAAREGVARLYAGWDDALAERLAADNLFLDEPAAKRRAALEALRARHGACRIEGDIDAENALRGEWKMPCEKGSLHVTLTLAPTMPPRIQSLTMTGAMPAGASLARAAASLASLESAWSDKAASALLAKSADRAALKRRLDPILRHYGTCRPGEVLEADGAAGATLRFDCANGPLDVALALEAKTGRLASATFTKPDDVVCPP
jgi:CubicO group peptidase (beta-lactamase class C family)